MLLGHGSRRGRGTAFVSHTAPPAAPAPAPCGLGLRPLQGPEAAGFPGDAEPPAHTRQPRPHRPPGSPPTFLVGIFSFRNSASRHSTFQGAWIFRNPTPWIFVWGRRGAHVSRRSRGQKPRSPSRRPAGCGAATPGGSLLSPHRPPPQQSGSPPCAGHEGARGHASGGTIAGEPGGPGVKSRTPSTWESFGGLSREPPEQRPQRKPSDSAEPSSPHPPASAPSQPGAGRGGGGKTAPPGTSPPWGQATPLSACPRPVPSSHV